MRVGVTGQVALAIVAKVGGLEIESEITVDRGMISTNHGVIGLRGRVIAEKEKIRCYSSRLMRQYER